MTVAPSRPVHEVLAAAAALIVRHGLNKGHYWPDAMWWSYRDGGPCDATGAIAVVLGARTVRGVEEQVAPHVDFTDDEMVPAGRCHPALAALMRHLSLPTLGDLFHWSDDDDLTAEQVATAMREAAIVDKLAEAAS
jgi:hypothetical protein